MRPAVERRIEQFARVIYPQSTSKRVTVDGIEFVEWISPDGRSIVAAFLGSVVIVGNDERVVRACSAVRRGAGQSLATSDNLKSIRSRLSGNTAAAFGYVSSAGLGKILASAAPLYVERISDSAQAQRLLAEAAAKVFQGAGWAATFNAGKVEDRYFVSLSPDVNGVLKEAFGTPPKETGNARIFLPSDTYSFTQYHLRDPRLAWRGLNRALSAHVDILGAVLLAPLLRAALWPYGIDDPEAFLGAIGQEIVTTRLDETESNSVLIVQASDEPSLQRLVQRRLGPRAHKETVASYEMYTSLEDSLSASFADQLLLMGPPESVRRCLIAKSQHSNLDQLRAHQLSGNPVFSPPPLAVTYARDGETVQRFLATVSQSQAMDQDKTLKALSEMPYSVSATNLSDDGFERTTRSGFGLFAMIAAQIASELPNQ
jgi:hypothetical protein